MRSVSALPFSWPFFPLFSASMGSRARSGIGLGLIVLGVASLLGAAPHPAAAQSKWQASDGAEPQAGWITSIAQRGPDLTAPTEAELAWWPGASRFRLDDYRQYLPKSAYAPVGYRKQAILDVNRAGTWQFRITLAPMRDAGFRDCHVRLSLEGHSLIDESAGRSTDRPVSLTGQASLSVGTYRAEWWTACDRDDEAERNPGIVEVGFDMMGAGESRFRAPTAEDLYIVPDATGQFHPMADGREAAATAKGAEATQGAPRIASRESRRAQAAAAEMVPGWKAEVVHLQGWNRFKPSDDAAALTWVVPAEGLSLDAHRRVSGGENLPREMGYRLSGELVVEQQRPLVLALLLAGPSQPCHVNWQIDDSVLVNQRLETGAGDAPRLVAAAPTLAQGIHPVSLWLACDTMGARATRAVRFYQRVRGDDDGLQPLKGEALRHPALAEAPEAIKPREKEGPQDWGKSTESDPKIPPSGQSRRAGLTPVDPYRTEYVAVSRVRVRAEPTTASAQTDSLEQGTPVSVVAVTGNGEKDWSQIRYDAAAGEAEGFIRNDLISESYVPRPAAVESAPAGDSGSNNAEGWRNPDAPSSAPPPTTPTSPGRKICRDVKQKILIDGIPVEAVRRMCKDPATGNWMPE